MTLENGVARAPKDQSRALGAAAEAFDLWQADRLEDAETRYVEALSRADPADARTADIHSAYAGLLSRLNRLGDAAHQYERALQLELRHDRDESAAPVIAARYVLGEHYLRMGEPESARKVVAPSLAAARKALAWIVEAEALLQCGGTDEARAAAECALTLAGSDDQRERIRARFAELL